ncbi:MAG: efflux RND transporter periplasmic adaptor subunit [Alphaproteobacteria bacterium]
MSLLVILVLSACSGEEETAPQAMTVEAIPIFTTPVRNEEVVDRILATGEVHADKTTEIKPRVNGVIDAIYVDVGDSVSAGAPLFRTRQSDFRTRVMQLEQGQILAQAELQQARQELERATQLKEKGVVSQGRMDAIVAQHDIARARLGISQATLDQARQDLADTTVRAPYDGIVTRRFVDEGTMIQIAGGGLPIVEIVKLDVVEVVAQVPASHLASIRAGGRVSVNFDGLAAPLETILHVVNDKIDARTRSVEIRLRLENPDLAIKPGLFAKVTLYPESRQAIVVARGAVKGIAGDNYVYIPDGSTARRRPVRIHDLDAERVEVLEGLEQGDLALIGPNLPDLKDGAPIALQQPRQASGLVPVVMDGADAPR